MNALTANAAFHALTGVARSVAKFTTEPLAADLFAWSAMTGTDIRIQSRLELLKVPFTAVTPVSLLKARLERRIEAERGKQERGHWSADWNRLIALKQALATVEAFEGAQ